MFSWKTFAIQTSKFEGIFDKNPDFWWYTLVLAMNNSITLIRQMRRIISHIVNEAYNALHRMEVNYYVASSF